MIFTLQPKQVTAPSNAAVDNIVGKVIEEGFCDGEGRRYFPKIVRVGRGLVSALTLGHLCGGCWELTWFACRVQVLVELVWMR